MRYFSGQTIGTVAALPQTTFVALCREVIERPIGLPLKRHDFHALPKKEQDKAKRTRYLTAATFKTPKSHRDGEHAGAVCNLLFLDIDSKDDPEEAARVIAKGFGVLGNFAHVVWHTASSLPERPRVRVMVHAEGVPIGLYGKAVGTIAGLLGIQPNTESLIAVQAMYLPVQFQGEETTPLVASNYEGEPFLPSDIQDVEGVAASDSAPTGVMGDLDFLRAPMQGITPADAESALAALDPDVSMKSWVETGMGLKHQFGEEGFALWDAWSSKGAKYDGHDKLTERWATFKANTPNRPPVTIRTVFKVAQDAGWKNEVVTKKVAEELKLWIANPQRSSEELIDQAPIRIAKVSTILSPLQRKATINSLRDTLESRGLELSTSDLRKAVHKAEIEAQRSAGVAAWTRGLCYCTGPNFFYQRLTDQRFKPEVLDLMYSTEPQGDERMMTPKHYAIQVAGIKQVENLRYDPRYPDKAYFCEDGQFFCNTYRPSYVAPDFSEEKISAAAQVIHTHLRHLIHEEQYRTKLLDFIAYLVQHPGKKIRWTPLIQSGEGAGKTWFAELGMAIFGRRNVAKLSGALVIEDKQNGWAYGSQLVVIEEIRVVGHNRHAAMDRLKPLITDGSFSLREFGQGPRTVPNLTNYMMFTNYQDALAVTEDSRRYFVVVSPLQTKADIETIGGEAYFTRIYNALETNPGGFRAFFEQWKISPDFNPNGRAPETPYLHQLAENASAPLTYAVRQTIADQPHALLRRDLLSFQVLRAHIEQNVRGLGLFTDPALAAVLRELGWTRRERYMVENERHNLWTKGQFRVEPGTVAMQRLELL